MATEVEKALVGSVHAYTSEGGHAVCGAVIRGPLPARYSRREGLVTCLFCVAKLGTI